MREFLFLIPALALAQTPAPKPATQAPKPAPVAAPKPASAVKPATGAATPKPAAAVKPGAPKPAAAVKPASAVKPAAAKPTAKPLALSTDDEKAMYCIGLSIAKSLGQFELSPAELDIVTRAIADAASGKPQIDLTENGPKIEPFARARGERAAGREKAASRAYIDKAAAEPGAQTAPSGFVYKELQAGTGPTPKASDTVKVHYRGTLTNGTEFDSSYKRNEPASFPLTGVIKCWTEGVQMIKVGGKGRLVCPSDIAYGDRGRPPAIPGGATLVFEIELLEIAPAAR